MQDDQGYYLTLPSDTCLDSYPDNNTASWTTKLRQPIQMKGKWEVCLSEIQYMQSMLTLPKAQTFLREGVTLQELHLLARALTDVQAAEELKEARNDLFRRVLSKTG